MQIYQSAYLYSQKMLIRSRSRGPVGPDCDYLCGNVFYMPQNVPPQSILAQPLPSPRRPNSAVDRRPSSQKGTRSRGLKPICTVKTPKRVIQGSTFDAKQASKFHERCGPEWVPAPGKVMK